MVDLHRMRFLINRLPMARYRVDIAMSRATKVTSVITGMPHGTTAGDSVPDNIERLMMAKKAYNDIKDELNQLRKELEPYIDMLDDPLEMIVIRERYISGHRAQDIAYTLNYSERRIFQVLSKAEKTLQSFH